MMSDPFVLLSSAIIRDADFESFLRQMGGVVDPEHLVTGRVSKGNRHVWLFLSQQALGEILEDSYDAVARSLGGVPRSCVVLELSQAQDSDKLVIDFSIAFAERWPAVLSDFEDGVLKLDDLRRLRKEEKGLSLTFPARGITSA